MNNALQGARKIICTYSVDILMQKQLFAYVLSSVYLHGGASGRAVGLTMVKVVLLILPGRTAQAEKGRG